MTYPILMKFSILFKYLEVHKKGYIKLFVKLYFKVIYSTVSMYLTKRPSFSFFLFWFFYNDIDTRRSCAKKYNPCSPRWTLVS